MFLSSYHEEGLIAFSGFTRQMSETTSDGLWASI